jgi:signal transduction histidine kinase
MHNLTNNAVRHNPRGTLIAVSLKVQNKQVVIDFSDDGIGIPAQLADNIFKPFVRGDSSRNFTTGGSGLGLSIAKKIAQAHGGDLTLLLSEKRGSTFRVTVPVI